MASPNQPVSRAWVSLTFDDGLYFGSRKIVAAFEPSRLPATFYLVPGWIEPQSVKKIHEPYNAGRSHGDWAFWRKVAEAGHETGSHTMTHRNATGPLMRWVPGLANWELKTSANEIERHLGVRPVSIAMPWNAASTRSDALVRKLYRTCRVGGAQPVVNNLAALDWHRLNSWAPRATTTVAEMMDVISTVKPGEWLILQFHSVDGEGYQPLPTSVMEELARSIRQLGGTEPVTVGGLHAAMMAAGQG